MGFGPSPGSRNHPAFGAVKNIRRKMTPEQVNLKDRNCLGAMGVAAAIYLSCLPVEVLSRTAEQAAEVGLPRVFSGHIRKEGLFCQILNH